MALRMDLVGNPNCGKTTLFNALTGSFQKAGNWPGATVEKFEGRIRAVLCSPEAGLTEAGASCRGCAEGNGGTDGEFALVKLPGIYSLTPYTDEERIACRYLLEKSPDVIINVVDATNLERNLYLTTQLMDLKVPVIIALNMMDLADAQSPGIPGLEKKLRIPVVPISARAGTGLGRLLARAGGLEKSPAAKSPAWCPEELCRSVGLVAERYRLFGLSFRNYPPFLASLRLLENDAPTISALNIPRSFLGTVAEVREKIEKRHDRNFDEMVVDARYDFIRGLISDTEPRSGNAQTFSDKIDRVVLNRFLGIPIFLLVMLCVFGLTFGGGLGGRLNALLSGLFSGRLSSAVSQALTAAGAGNFLISLTVNGILFGVGSVVSFLPWILILFFFLSYLDDCGYLARVAFLFDRAFRRFGLSGGALIPAMLGFGCTVPALMSTRAIKNEKERRVALMVTPFISCSARLPVYVLFTAAFFASRQAAVIFCIYLLGILAAVSSGAVLSRMLGGGGAAPLMLELPPYRLPSLKNILFSVWNRTRQFLIRAGTIIFVSALVVWFLQSFSLNGAIHMTGSAENSILADIGRAITPFFAPLGFGDWRSAVALLTGFIAKELVVSTIGVLHGTAGAGIVQSVRTAFTPLSAFSFMVFTLLYLPCMAAFATLKREMNSWRWTIFTLLFEIGVAWLVSFVIYQGGRLLGFS